MTETSALGLVQSKYGDLSDLLKKHDAMLMGGSVASVIKRVRPLDTDICLARKNLEGVIQEFKTRGSFFVVQKNGYEVILYQGRRYHLHINRDHNYFFEIRKSLFWNGGQFVSVYPPQFVLQHIQFNKIVICKKFYQVNSELINRFNQEKILYGYSYETVKNSSDDLQ